MREIKFRAWGPSEKRLTNGNTLKRTCEIARDMQDWYWCDDNIIMQYTGIKDKNGKEIYEGDIVISKEYGHTYEVVWNKITAGFKLKSGDSFFHIADRNDHTEVVGNIYENPELLNQNK